MFARPGVVLAAAEANLVAVAPGDRAPVLVEEDGVHRLVAVEALGERAGLFAAAREPVHLSGAIGGADGDVRALLAATEEAEVGVGGLERSGAVHLGLAVVRAEDHVVALEELLPAAGGIEQRADRAVCVAELRGGAFRAERVRGIVVVREVEEEEVEAVPGDEPAADGGSVGVDGPRGTLAYGERRTGLVGLEQVVEEEALGAERGARHAGQVAGARCARGSR